MGNKAARRRPSRPLLLLTVAVHALTLGAPARAQEDGELDLLLDRLGRYLIAYEAELATVIADEHYEQLEIGPLRISGTGRAATILTQGVRRKRKLESEVAFLRLPGGSTWYGVRDVRKVDGKTVVDNDTAVRLQELVKQLDSQALQEAAKIILRSAQHNLGGLRTVNMPTVPLEILHPIRHVQLMFKVGGTDTIGGTRTTRLEFEEFDEPTIISTTEGAPMFVKGSAWLEAGSGRLWRVSMTITPKVKGGRRLPQFENRMRVDYVPHAQLGMMVPKELYENFWIPSGRGEGRARYSNFRQFATSARVIPQR
jgi:hypothetical protein